MLMKTKDLYALETGREAAERMMQLLAPVCQRVVIAGSVRRRRPQVHDVDLVIWPLINAYTQTFFQPGLFSAVSGPIDCPAKLFDLCRQRGWGNWQVWQYPRIVRIPSSEMSTTAVERIPIELYVCEPDGSNFEALLQLRTGSAQFNRRLAGRASELGLKYKAGYGIFDNEYCVDGGTERGIFEAVGWQWVQPELRE